MAASVVQLWESAGKLAWLLLCNYIVLNGLQARKWAQQYASRWLMEDFHKALKTGLGAERLQLHTAARLFAAVALLSVVALVDLREHSRQRLDAPPETACLSALYLSVLRSKRSRPLQTVQEVYYALAGFGGHLGRTSDGPPGWQTLLLGTVHLRYLVEGVKLAGASHKFWVTTSPYRSGLRTKTMAMRAVHPTRSRSLDSRK